MICAVDACNAMILFQNHTELGHLGLRVCGEGRKQRRRIISNDILFLRKCGVQGTLTRDVPGIKRAMKILYQFSRLEEPCLQPPG
jgi:hypothetical protein